MHFRIDTPRDGETQHPRWVVSIFHPAKRKSTKQGSRSTQRQPRTAMTKGWWQRERRGREIRPPLKLGKLPHFQEAGVRSEGLAQPRDRDGLI